MDRALRVWRWGKWLGVAYLVTRVVSSHGADVAPNGVQAIDDVVRSVAPSVVAIRARGRHTMSGSEARFTETGSGVLVSDNGEVLTAAYVVHGMDDIVVEFADGEIVPAGVVASEPAAADLSLLKLDRVPAGATPSPIADSNTVKVGDPIVILGAARGGASSVSVGSITARWAPNTAYRTMPLAEFFQTDARIDTVNSGGPMVNLRGEIVGIVSFNISRGDRSDERGFVVTSNTAIQLLLGKRASGAGVADTPCAAKNLRRC